jgi:hypothetical protein
VIALAHHGLEEGSIDSFDYLDILCITSGMCGMCSGNRDQFLGAGGMCGSGDAD